MEQREGIIVTIIGGSLWGLSGTAGQYLMNVLGVEALGLTKIRMLIAGILLTIYAFVNYREDFRRLLSNRRDGIGFLLFAVFGMTFNQISYLTAISYSDAGTATVLQYLGPVFIVLYTCIRGKRLPESMEVMSLALALTGTFILVTGGNPGVLKISETGLFWGIAAAVALTFYNILPVDILKRYRTVTITGLSMAVGGLLLAPVTPPSEIPLTIRSAAALFAVIILGTLLSYTLYLRGVSLIGPVKASLIVCVEPISAVFFSKLFLKTAITGTSVIGMILILGAVILLSLRKEENQLE